MNDSPTILEMGLAITLALLLGPPVVWLLFKYIFWVCEKMERIFT